MEGTREAEEPVTADLGDLLDKGDGASVSLVAGETRLVAHRAVLEKGSPVFAAIFRRDTLEASSGEVAVADVAGPVLRLLLAFLYRPWVPQLPVAVLLQLLAAADKYGVTALKEVCERQAVAQLTVEEAAAVAVTAVRHSCSSLREAVVDFIKSHVFEVMATRGWADAVRMQSEDIVEISRLLSETDTPPPAPAGPRPSPATGPHGDGRHSPASAPPAIAASGSSAPLVGASVSKLRSLSLAEKERRLREAVQWGTARELKALLAAGAPVDAGTGCRETPLHLAACRGHTLAVRLLLAAGADHSARDVGGLTPLHYAADRGHRGAVAALLEWGADTAAGDIWGRTALDRALRFDHEQVAALLQGR